MYPIPDIEDAVDIVVVLRTDVNVTAGVTTVEVELDAVEKLDEVVTVKTT